MKKFLGILFLIASFVAPTLAEEFSTVCASHILVPTEMEAIKLKSQIKSFDDFIPNSTLGYFKLRFVQVNELF